MLCSIFLLDEDGLHLRYGVAPNLPQAYQAATDGTCIGPNVGSFCNQNSTIGLFHLWCYGERILPSPTRFPQKAQQSLPCNRTQEKRHGHTTSPRKLQARVWFALLL